VARRVAPLLEQLVVRLPVTRAQEQPLAQQWAEPLVESTAAKQGGKNGNNRQTPKRQRPTLRMRTIGH